MTTEQPNIHHVERLLPERSFWTRLFHRDIPNILVLTFGDTASRQTPYLFTQLKKKVGFISFNNNNKTREKKVDNDLHFKNILNTELKKYHKQLGFFRRPAKTKEKIVLISGLGGNYGSYYVVEAAQMLHNNGYNELYTIVQMPFDFEGKIRRQHAENSLASLDKLCTQLYIYDHAKLSKKQGDLTLNDYFQKIDDNIVRVLKNILKSTIPPINL